jgi:nitrosocyanin
MQRNSAFLLSLFCASMLLVGAGCASGSVPTAQMPVVEDKQSARLMEGASAEDPNAVEETVEEKESEVEKLFAEVEGEANAPIAETADTELENVPSAVSASKVVTIAVRGGSYYFTPNEIKVKKGDTVKVVFTNDGGMHNFLLDAFNVSMDPIKVGESKTLTFVADKTGSFEYYCGVGKHRQMGQKGILVVE